MSRVERVSKRNNTDSTTLNASIYVVNMVCGRRISNKARNNHRNIHTPAGNYNISSGASVLKYGAHHCARAI